MDRKFKDLSIGDRFEVFGDHHLNYNYPKICKCIKIDADTGQEINGIRFEMLDNDVVDFKG